MKKTNLTIRFVDLKNSVEMYVDNELYTTQNNKSFCFGFLLQDYFLEVFKEINLKPFHKIEWFDSNLKYFKEYKEGYKLYIQSDISFIELKDIFKSIKYCIKEIDSNNFILECRRDLIKISAYQSPALYFSDVEKSWFIISGSDVNLKLDKEISLFFDVLYIQIKINTVKKKYSEDENSFVIGKSYEHLLDDDFEDDEDDGEDEKEDMQEKLF